jgi:hypothetical protein
MGGCGDGRGKVLTIASGCGLRTLTPMANDFIVKPLFAAASGFIPDLIHVGSVSRVTRADRHLGRQMKRWARPAVSRYSAPFLDDPGEGGQNSEAGLQRAAESSGDL